MGFNENSNSSDDRTMDTEWLEIKHTGIYETHYINAPVKEVNWVYTPSGRFCVCVWDVAKKNEQNVYYINEYLFTFMDLVNKEYFEMAMKFEPFLTNRLNASKVDCFYFSSEVEMIVIAAYNGLLNNWSIKLIILIRNWNFKKQYFLLLVSNKERWILCDCYLIYMIPKDPSNKDAPTKEFCCYFKNHFRDTDERIKAGEKFNRFLLSTTLYPCIISDTKLWFSLELFAYSANGMDHYDTPGTLVGANWTVDLKKLKNIKEQQIDGPKRLLEILEEQAAWHTFEDAGVFHIAKELNFRQSDPDVGFINVFTYNSEYGKNGSVAHTYPAKISGAKPVILEAELIEGGIEGCYTLHPHGALLNVAFSEESIYLRVVKCLKANLKSLALNRALFNKETPLRHHRAYRLCFNGGKPTQYTVDNEYD